MSNPLPSNCISECCFYVCVEEYDENDNCVVNTINIDFNSNITNINNKEYQLIIEGNCVNPSGQTLNIISDKNDCYGCGIIKSSEEKKCNKESIKILLNNNYSPKILDTNLQEYKNDTINQESISINILDNNKDCCFVAPKEYLYGVDNNSRIVEIDIRHRSYKVLYETNILCGLNGLSYDPIRSHFFVFDNSSAKRLCFINESNVLTEIANKFSSTEMTELYTAAVGVTGPLYGPSNAYYHNNSIWIIRPETNVLYRILLNYNNNIPSVSSYKKYTIPTLPSTNNIFGDIAIHPNTNILYAISQNGFYSLDLTNIDSNNNLGSIYSFISTNPLNSVPPGLSFNYSYSKLYAQASDGKFYEININNGIFTDINFILDFKANNCPGNNIGVRDLGGSNRNARITATSTPTPTNTITPTVSPTITTTTTITATNTTTPTTTPTTTTTSTVTPTNTTTPAESATPTVTPTNTITPTETMTPTVSPTNTTTQTPTITPSTSSQNNITLEYLSVAGGGSGGTGSGGGGGAGGMVSGVLSVSSGETWNITIGAGGSSGGNPANNGNNSFLTKDFVTNYGNAIGGGAGGCNTGSRAGNSGGSGGGEAGTGYSGSDGAGSGTIGQGNNGGLHSSTGPAYGSGGGGGASSAGQNGTSSSGGNGGNGLSSSITGSSVTYAGGGAGGAYDVAGGVGGLGGGGDLGVDGGNAPANYGGGGAGGIGNGSNGGNGGSGIVIIKSLVVASSTTGSPTITTDGAYTIYQFTGTGSITF